MEQVIHGIIQWWNDKTVEDIEIVLVLVNMIGPTNDNNHQWYWWVYCGAHRRGRVSASIFGVGLGVENC